MDYILLISGLIILIACGEFLVKGAVNLALKLNIPPMIIGLTVVSIGTSAPELFASLKAAGIGAADISVGNVIGSNIANLGLVLGLTTLIFPVAVKRSLLWYEWIVLILVSTLFVLFSIDGQLSKLDGIIFILLLIAYISFLVITTIRKNKKDSEKELLETNEIPKVPKPWAWIVLYIIIGFVGLYFGAEWLIAGAIGIAKSFDISEFVIGVTVVAFGTSVPELATSAIAAFKKESDISIGNLIGSNIFNILGVLGVTSIVHPLGINESLMKSDFFWMMGVALILFPMIYFSNKISRVSGLILLGGYIVYVSLLLF